MITGTSLVRRISRQTEKPSVSGSIRSSSTTSGSTPASVVSPSPPFAASATWYPSSCSASRSDPPDPRRRPRPAARVPRHATSIAPRAATHGSHDIRHDTVTPRPTCAVRDAPVTAAVIRPCARRGTAPPVRPPVRAWCPPRTRDRMTRKTTMAAPSVAAVVRARPCCCSPPAAAVDGGTRTRRPAAAGRAAVRGGTLNMLGAGDVDYMDPNICYYCVGYPRCGCGAASCSPTPPSRARRRTPSPTSPPRCRPPARRHQQRTA